MLCIKREENSVERVACVSGAILRVGSNRVNQLQKTILILRYTRGITRKHVTSGGAHFYACATVSNPEKNVATVANLPHR